MLALSEGEIGLGRKPCVSSGSGSGATAERAPPGGGRPLGAPETRSRFHASCGPLQVSWQGGFWDDELRKRLSPSLKRIDELRQRRSTLEAETRRVARQSVATLFHHQVWSKLLEVGAYPERAVKSTQERLVRAPGKQPGFAVSSLFERAAVPSAQVQSQVSEAFGQLQRASAEDSPGGVASFAAQFQPRVAVKELDSNTHVVDVESKQHCSLIMVT